MDPVVFVNKWLHLVSIIGVLGGVIFAWLVLVPAERDPANDSALAPLWKRFGIGQAVLWVVVLITGFYNFFRVAPTVNSGYHMYLGMKMALAILMFIAAMLTAHPMPAMQKLTRRRKPWLVVLLTLGVVIVGLSAHLNLSRISGSGLKAVPLTLRTEPAGAP